MNKKLFWLSILAVVISFIGGFILANTLNRRELDELRAEIGRLKTPAPMADEKDSQSTLSDEEIRQKIAEADSNSGNLDFQKNLAVALYRYSAMKQESKWLPEVTKLLTRVIEKNPKDYNTLISLGDVYFDLAQSAANSDSAETKADQNKNIEQSREFYRQALAMNPNDAQLQTDFGATFLFANPPDNEKAITAFQKSLQTNPKNEKTLEFIAKALLNTGKNAEAQKSIDQLKTANPKNGALPDLEKQLSQSVKKQ